VIRWWLLVLVGALLGIAADAVIARAATLVVPPAAADSAR
jgi:hypothetical protein